MEDRLARIALGAFVVPAADDLDGVLAQVRAAEEAGLELIGIQDHPYQRRYLDTFALLAFLAARTSRITLFPDVANLPLRQPALLATHAATLDVLSGGRFELGLGAGAFWDAIAAMGGPKRTPGESVEALEEALAILRAAWSGERSVTFTGEHYTIRGFHPGPRPAHDIGIWLGAYKPRMLRLTGRAADGWIPSLPRFPLEELAAAGARIDEAAERAGRDPRQRPQDRERQRRDHGRSGRGAVRGAAGAVGGDAAAAPHRAPLRRLRALGRGRYARADRPARARGPPAAQLTAQPLRNRMCRWRRS
jgi:alkanesulfonate monooxygenase SsuD/methylene tetrahydromethanopterin reductase-like flavin-dependent oxidoreductase (luciferase family)